MSEDVEWGPWVDHDGKGCPLPVGMIFEGKYEWLPGRFMMRLRAVEPDMPAWDWRNWGRVMPCGRKQSVLRRYRIRKPRALLDLIQIADQPYAPPPVIHPESPTRAPQPEGVPA